MGTRVGFTDIEKLFELGELPLETHVRKDDRATLARKCECVLKGHVSLVHEKRDHTARRS